jgi:NAD-dependent dihydropyrimidine dehydrogenase PreA subunit
MKKILKAFRMENCIGCELCVLEAQRQLKKVGTEGSLVRIFKHTSKGTNVVLDPTVNNLDIKKIKEICPTSVFEIAQEDEHEFER